jgi:7,8-dihydropterin-6-yl-methyl-4-(beta-D-ribofuranosyl)aminobenzene 5'-phosphate synthase
VTIDLAQTAAVRLTVLCDNHAARPTVATAHGLSVLVETAERRVLFDTGTDRRTVENADTLGISLTGLDAIILSHGHYDHVGGLEAVLARTGPVPVIAHPELFRRAFTCDDSGEQRFIGPPLSQEQYAALGADFRAPGDCGLLGDLIATACPTDSGAAAPRLHQRFLREGDGGLVPDAFCEETSLIVRVGGAALILTGCAHRGPAEVVRDLRGGANEQLPITLMGGLHLGAHRRDEVRRLALRLHAMGVTCLLPCHCTTEGASTILAETFLGRVDLPGVGSVIEIAPDGTATLRHPWVS